MNRIILNNKFKIRSKNAYSHQNDEVSKKYLLTII